MKPCPAARDLPLDLFPSGCAVTCARCGASLRAGAEPAQEAWCAGVGDVTPDATLDDPDAFPPLTTASTIGRWRLERKLGVGGAGVVYRAWDTVLERPVALKLLSAGAWASPMALARFRREAKAAGQLGLPGVVRILDVGMAEGAPWLAMELVDGPSLAAVRADGPMSAQRAATFCVAVARTLAAIHAAGLAHRDVKPSNIVLDPRGNPVLVDFGLVVPLTDSGGETRGQVGTPAYMAPEQLGDTSKLDWRRVDIFALGRVLRELCPAPPADLAAIGERATWPDPEGRYPDAARLADDLDAFLDGRPISARQGGVVHRARLFLRRHQGALALGGVLLLLLAGATAGAQQWRIHSRRAAREAREAELDHRIAALIPEMDRLDASGGDAESLLLALVDDPENARTAARATGWNLRARRLHDAGRTDAAREAWARGILVARRPADRATGLLGLAETLRAGSDWGALHRTLALIDAEHPTRAPAPDAPIRVALAVAIGDLEGAARLSNVGDAAFLRGWTTATRIADEGGSYAAYRAPRGDGHDVAYVLRHPDGGILRVDANGAEPLHDTTRACTPEAAFLGRPGPNGHRLIGLYPEGIVDCGPLEVPCSPVVVGEELYMRVGDYTRKLYTRPFAGGPVRIADADTDALGSFTFDIRQFDLDGDGTEEVLFATGPALGYGLRLFDRVDGALKLRARALLGMPTAAMRYDRGWLVVGTTNERPSRYLFGAEHPNGVAPGIHLVQLDGATFKVGPSYPNPGGGEGATDPSTWSAPIWTGDADADGLPDVVGLHVGDGRAWVSLYRGAPGPTLREVRLEGWRPIVAAQLDDDPAPEILAQRGASSTYDSGPLYVLGLGSEPVPRLDLGPDPVVPDAGPPALMFARLGLHDSAARALERAARVEASPATRSSLFALAAEEWERDGEPASAAADWAEARAGAADPTAVEQRAEAAWIRAGRFDEAGGVLAALAGPGTAVDLVHPDPAWQLGPDLARPNLRSGALDLTTVGGAGRVARLPLRRTGAMVRLRMELHVQREEWGAGFAMVLRSGASHGNWFFESRTQGGGGILSRYDSAPDCGSPLLVNTADVTEDLVFDIAISAEESWRVLTRDGVEVARCHREAQDLGSDAWTLEINPADDGLTGVLARASITSLRLWGLEPRVEARPPQAPSPLLAVREAPGDASHWRVPITGFARFRAAWEALADVLPEDPELSAALRQLPDPTPFAARSADARWALVTRGRAAWAAGTPEIAVADLRAALATIGAGEGMLALTAHATLGEIAAAGGDLASATRERELAITTAPTAEVGELLLRRYTGLPSR